MRLFQDLFASAELDANSNDRRLIDTEIAGRVEQATQSRGVILCAESDKAEGWAGVRVGYALGPPEPLKQVRSALQPWLADTLAAHEGSAPLRRRARSARASQPGRIES